MKMDKKNSSAAKAKASQLRKNVKFMKGRCTTENLTPQQTIAMIEQPCLNFSKLQGFQICFT